MGGPGGQFWPMIRNSHSARGLLEKLISSLTGIDAMNKPFWSPPFPILNVDANGRSCTNHLAALRKGTRPRAEVLAPSHWISLCMSCYVRKENLMVFNSWLSFLSFYSLMHPKQCIPERGAGHAMKSKGGMGHLLFNLQSSLRDRNQRNEEVQKHNWWLVLGGRTNTSLYATEV